MLTYFKLTNWKLEFEGSKTTYLNGVVRLTMYYVENNAKWKVQNNR